MLATDTLAAPDGLLAGDVQLSPSPSEPVVTPTAIVTANDTIPRLSAQATISTLKSGNWSDPTVWSLGRLPTDNDKVSITTGTDIIYDVVSDASLQGMEISGTLSFATDRNTQLKVKDLLVMPSGTLEIGTPAAPVQPQYTAELIIADKPLDTGTVANPGSDPMGYGTGLIAFGTVTMHGASSVRTWIPLVGQADAGDATLTLTQAPVGWLPGQTLVLPDSRQPLASDYHLFDADQIPLDIEEPVIDHVVGNTVYLTQPLQFDHDCGVSTDGSIALMPDVGLLDHNVIVRSENPNGTRGYTLFEGRAVVDIEYTQFEDLGRTGDFQLVDDTTFDANGNVTHIGTNQEDRYAVYFSHLMGPVNPTNTGYQYTFEGNSVERSLKWAVALEDTDYGLLEDNVVYDAQGAGICTEDGSEIGNDITSNFTVYMHGTHSSIDTATDFGRGGVGFWYRRSGNNDVGNVAADSTFAGWVYDSYYAWDAVLLPTSRGVDPLAPGQGAPTLNNPSGTFDDNEAYGMSDQGMWAAYITGNNTTPNQPQMTFNNLTIWNVLEAGVTAYHTSNTTFDGLLILGDPAAQDRPDFGTYGMSIGGTYENNNMLVENSRIEGTRIGIQAPTADASDFTTDRPTIIENSILNNYINIVVQPKASFLSADGNSLVVQNVKFGVLTQVPAGTSAASGPAYNILMSFTSNNGEPMNATAFSRVRVYDYNQVPGDDIQVFYKEQAPSYVLPQTDPSLLYGSGSGLIGGPQAGMTNQQSWDEYRIAAAGAISPTTDDTTHPEIYGFTAPLPLETSPVHRVVFVTPWQGAQVAGNAPVRVRYYVIGGLPAGSQIYFDLDGTTPFTSLDDGGIWWVPEGAHVLHAYIGDITTGVKVPGTDETYVAFSVSLSGATYSLAGLIPSTPPSPVGISNVSVPVNSPPTVVNLFGTFVDNHDSAGSLTYTIVGNTNPQLFTSTTIDGIVGTLALAYLPNTSGVADLAIRATDTAGQFAETAFTVTVGTPHMVRGDMNGDGVLNNFDAGPFELALSGSSAYLQQFPHLTDYATRGDANLDGRFNNFDIASFEEMLAGSVAPAVAATQRFALKSQPSTSTVGLSVGANLQSPADSNGVVQASTGPDAVVQGAIVQGAAAIPAYDSTEQAVADAAGGQNSLGTAAARTVNTAPLASVWEPWPAVDENLLHAVAVDRIAREQQAAAAAGRP